jgi:small-conductance mechanosensitive channel
MDEQQKSSLTQSQWNLIILILAVAAGSVTYRLVLFKKLEQTSMVFIGIPLLIAAILEMTPKSRRRWAAFSRESQSFCCSRGRCLAKGSSAF